VWAPEARSQIPLAGGGARNPKLLLARYSRSALRCSPLHPAFVNIRGGAAYVDKPCCVALHCSFAGLYVLNGGIGVYKRGSRSKEAPPTIQDRGRVNDVRRTAVCQAGGYMTVQAAAKKVGVRGRAIDGQERHSSTDDQVLAPRIYLFPVAPKYMILSFVCRPALSQFVHPGSALPANCDCICERA